MDILSIVIGFVVGIIVGAAIGWLLRSVRSQTGSKENAAETARLEQLAGRTTELEAALKERTASEQEAQKTAVQLQAELDGVSLRLTEQKEREEKRETERRAEAERRENARKEDDTQKTKDQERMVAQFKAAAHEIVEERTKAFDEKSKKSIGELVKPLKEQLDGFRKQLSETEKSASEERISLKEQVKNLKELNGQISDEARNLTRALKGESKTRGNWGEMVLSRVLELSGLTEGREYETEVSETNEEGKRKRPDVIVQLPGNRQVVIDAKVTLNHYDAYCEAEADDDRNAAMKQHVASIRGHAKGLSDKSYQHLESINTLDYVLMFMPIEAAFTEAMRADRTIFDDAISKRVLIVTPSTLLAVLRTIETIWRHERQTKNVLEIARQAGQLHDKFVGFSVSLEKIGQRIVQAQAAYDSAFSQLTTGKGNLVKRVQNLQTLGAKTSKQIPESLLEAATEGADDDEVAPVIDLVTEEVAEPS